MYDVGSVKQPKLYNKSHVFVKKNVAKIVWTSKISHGVKNFKTKNETIDIIFELH